MNTLLDETTVGNMNIRNRVVMAPMARVKTAALHWLAKGADLISFGRLFISNPDLVERLRDGLPLALNDEATWYAGRDDGYITYPTHQKVA